MREIVRRLHCARRAAVARHLVQSLPNLVHELWRRSALPGAGELEVPQDAAAENGGVSTSAAAGGAAAVDANDEASLCGALFRGLVFFLGREVPREALLLVIRCANALQICFVQICRSTGHEAGLHVHCTQ